MSIFIKPKIRWNQECVAIELSWQPTKEEELVLHNFAWEAHNQGTLDERERIIKLLEEHAEQKFADNFDTSKDTCHEDVCDLCANWNGLGVAVALIKGENK